MFPPSCFGAKQDGKMTRDECQRPCIASFSYSRPRCVVQTWIACLCLSVFAAASYMHVSRDCPIFAFACLSPSFHIHSMFHLCISPRLPSLPHNEFLLISFYNGGGGGAAQQRRKGHFGIVCSSFAACRHSVSSSINIGRKCVVKVHWKLYWK